MSIALFQWYSRDLSMSILQSFDALYIADRCKRDSSWLRFIPPGLDVFRHRRRRMIFNSWWWKMICVDDVLKGSDTPLIDTSMTCHHGKTISIERRSGLNSRQEMTTSLCLLLETAQSVGSSRGTGLVSKQLEWNHRTNRIDRIQIDAWIEAIPLCSSPSG